MPEPVLSAEEVTAYVREVFSEADIYNWQIKEIRPNGIAVLMQTDEAHIRPGGTVSGPTMFALADITAYLLILAHVGKVALAVTTNLSINFLNKPEPGMLEAHGRLVKLGKRLAVCDIHIYGPDGSTMVAQATATYSIPPR